MDLLSEEERASAQRLGLRPDALLAEETNEDEGAVDDRAAPPAPSRLRRGSPQPPTLGVNARQSVLLKSAIDVTISLSAVEVKKLDSGEETHQRTGPLGDLIGVIFDTLAPMRSVEVSYQIETTVATPGGVKRFSVRRAVWEIHKLRELLVASRPWLVLPIHEDADADPLAPPERIVQVTPALLESRRRRCEAFLRRCARHAEVGTLQDVEDFLCRPDFMVALALERPDAAGDPHAAAGPPASLPRVLSLEDVTTASDDIALRFQKSFGLLPSIPERPFEDAAWGATLSYLKGLGEHIRKAAVPLRSIARLRSQMQRELEGLSSALEELSAYEATGPGPEPAREERRAPVDALRRAAASTRAAARAEVEEGMEGEAALADALAGFEHVDAFFKEAERERQRRLLRIEKLEAPLRQDKKKLAGMIESGHFSALEALTDRLAVVALHGVAVQERRALREARLKTEIARLEGEEEAAIAQYDAYCDRLRAEVRAVQDTAARELDEAFGQYAALKARGAQKLAEAWDLSRG